MNKEKLLAAMKTSISDVLEKMFFLPAEVLNTSDVNAAAAVDDFSIGVQLHFSGPESGTFLLLVPGKPANRISADFLGIDLLDLTDTEVVGTIKEMLNMLAGNTLSVYDADTVYNLAVPEAVAADSVLCVRHSGGDSARIDIETLEGRMVFAIVPN